MQPDYSKKVQKSPKGIFSRRTSQMSQTVKTSKPKIHMKAIKGQNPKLNRVLKSKGR